MTTTPQPDLPRRAGEQEGAKTYILTGADGIPYESAVPGTLGGNRRRKLYGRLDCRAALAALARGGHARDRVFFADQATAETAGYRPCAVCLPGQYKAWKARRQRLEAATD